MKLEKLPLTTFRPLNDQGSESYLKLINQKILRLNVQRYDVNKTKIGGITFSQRMKACKKEMVIKQIKIVKFYLKSYKMWRKMIKDMKEQHTSISEL